VVHNAITSRFLAELVAGSNGTTSRTRVGHAFVKKEMAERNAVFGAEHSAHYYFRDFFYADTGVLAAMHVLAYVAGGKVTMAEASDMFTPYFASGEINSRLADPQAAMARVRAAYQADADAGRVVFDTLDGLTVDHWDQTPRWWANVRPSNTEPLLRLNVEAGDQDVMEKVRDGVLGLIRDEDIEEETTQ
jgi:phosphomannomutase